MHPKTYCSNPPFLESGQDTRQDLDLVPELKATEFVKTWHHRSLSLRIWRPFKVTTSNPNASRNPPDCHPRAPSAKRTKAKPRLCKHATTNQLMQAVTHGNSPKKPVVWGHSTFFNRRYLTLKHVKTEDSVKSLGSHHWTNGMVRDANLLCFFLRYPKGRWFGEITPVCFGGFYVRCVESHVLDVHLLQVEQRSNMVAASAGSLPGTSRGKRTKIGKLQDIHSTRSYCNNWNEWHMIWRFCKKMKI